jgi:predicted nucleic acid-binding protein
MLRWGWEISFLQFIASVCLLNNLKIDEENNGKFADAVMELWGMGKGITTIYTYDEVDFKRIEGLTVLKP